MKKTLISITLILITISFLLNTEIIISSVNYSLNIFLNNVFPTLFPFFILSTFLINFNIIESLNKYTKNTLQKLFKISSHSSLVILLSLITGLPSNAKYIKTLLDKKLISLNEATKVLTYTFFPNPMFVIGTVGLLFLNNKRIGLILLISIYLTNFIIALLIRNKLESITINNKEININNYSFSYTLKTSIIDSVKTLILILGSITLFVTLTNILFHYINFPPLIKAVFSSSLEMTHGLKLISTLEIKENIKIILLGITLMFNGLCIISQVVSILEGYKLNYRFIFKYKIISLLIITLILTLFILINNQLFLFHNLNTR